MQIKGNQGTKSAGVKTLYLVRLGLTARKRVKERGKGGNSQRNRGNQRTVIPAMSVNKCDYGGHMSKIFVAVQGRTSLDQRGKGCVQRKSVGPRHLKQKEQTDPKQAARTPMP